MIPVQKTLKLIGLEVIDISGRARPLFRVRNDVIFKRFTRQSPRSVDIETTLRGTVPMPVHRVGENRG
jgi:hypothetical protein